MICLLKTIAFVSNRFGMTLTEYRVTATNVNLDEEWPLVEYAFFRKVNKMNGVEFFGHNLDPHLTRAIKTL